MFSSDVGDDGCEFLVERRSKVDNKPFGNKFWRCRVFVCLWWGHGVDGVDVGNVVVGDVVIVAVVR